MRAGHKRSAESRQRWQAWPIEFPLVENLNMSSDPIIIKTLIDSYEVSKVYLDRGSASEIMNEHCFRQLPQEIYEKLKPTKLGFFRRNIMASRSNWFGSNVRKLSILQSSHTKICVGKVQFQIQYPGRAVMQSLEPLLPLSHKNFMRAKNGHNEISAINVVFC